MNPMTSAYILNLAANAWPKGQWWEREAAVAVATGRFLIIPTRNDHHVYIARCWLTEPLRIDGEPESGNSTFLQYFARGDDDQALHDHPWDFRTTILHGGYIEHLPPEDWLAGDRWFGPAWDQRIVPHGMGDTVHHRAEDLHCVGHTQPGTWTLMRTGHRRRAWGFHPPGRPWIPYRTFLDLRKPDPVIASP